MKMLVLGAGISGRGALRLAERLGYDAAVFDRDPAAVESLMGTARFGGDWTDTLLDGIDVVVTSPGIPEHAPPLVSALGRGLPVWSELEFAARHIDASIVAVTGTNGKTTVTSLVASMLKNSGIRSTAAGNIGTALTDMVGAGYETIVVEASSFQLRFIERFAPHVAVLLNIAPDHLDWHRTFRQYRDAKANIVLNAGPDVPLVYDGDDPEASTVAEGAASVPVPVSGTARVERGWGVDGDLLVLPGLSVPLEHVPAKDAAFRLDLAAAGTAAALAGATSEAIRKAIEGFQPISHRRTLVGTWRGVTWVDDSKATNPHSALAAVRAYPSVVLIAGGRNKDLDLSPIVRQPEVRAVVAIGEAAPDVLAAAGGLPAVRAASMREAVKAASELAGPGDTVLLAPGCASFDMFKSYGHRGEAFREAVIELEERT